MGSGKILVARYLGEMAYPDALDLQLSAQQARMAEEIPDTLFFLEHKACYTCGKRASDTDFLIPPDELTRRGYGVYRTSRGGQITYHGPGQLICYFIINLYQAHRELRQFITRIETGLCTYLQTMWQLDARTEAANPGVWVGNQKIAALGIAINSHVTMHGIALNVSPDLGDFAHIVPCGIHNRGVCSLQSLTGQSPELRVVAQGLAGTLQAALGYQTLEWQD